MKQIIEPDWYYKPVLLHPCLQIYAQKFKIVSKRLDYYFNGKDTGCFLFEVSLRDNLNQSSVEIKWARKFSII